MYIGSSSDIGKRICAHLGMLRRGTHNNVKLQRAWIKYGESSLTFGVVELVEMSKLLEREQYWIDFYNVFRDGYNMAVDATAPMKGRHHSELTRNGFSISRMGSNNSNWHPEKQRACLQCGKTFRPKYRDSQKYCSHKCYSDYRKSHMTNELRYKCGNSGRGRKHTLESLEKRFNKRAGKFIVTDPSGIIYNVFGLARFCREHNLDQGSMSKVSLGRSRAYKGWTCKKVEVK
jgi:group I intron endonuclease